MPPKAIAPLIHSSKLLNRPSPVIERTDTGQAGNNGQDNQGKAKWSDPLVILNLALFIAVLMQAGIYWKQLGEMRKTLGVLVRQADTQDKVAGTMQGQLNTMNAQTGTMREQVGLATKQVEAINISERAYIGIEGIGFADLEVGKIPRIVMIMKNAGRTPAKKIRAPGKISIEPIGKQPVAERIKSQHPGEGLLAANFTRPTVYEFPAPCDVNTLYQIVSETVKVFIQGTIWYEDVWGNEWDESFFLEWDNRQQSFLDRREKKAGEQERKNTNQNPTSD